ncbi:MAG: ATP-binding cassette domain-containing protein [bacterium]|nr:ATP-binding cassette domain-containing protein [bacterium]
MSVILRIENLTEQFKIRGNVFKPQFQTALDNFYFTVYDDRPVMTTIAGESGSGKTTLAHLLLGFMTPTAGHVLYQGKNLARLGAAEFRQYRTQVQAVFQDLFQVYNPLLNMSESSAAACFLYNTHTTCSDMSVLLEK